jgi:Holliday junction DNA helicase RuvA
MIASVSGIVSRIQTDTVVVLVGGVGLLLHVTPDVINGSRIGDELTLFTSLIVREESLTLYGFISSESQDVFELLQNASGIGPKTALAALTVHSPEAIRKAILEEDFKSLEMIPGVGRKSAQKLVIELTDRVKTAFLSNSVVRPNLVGAPWKNQIHAAMVGLGFAPKEIAAAIEQAEQALQRQEVETEDVSELLKIALRSRGRG